MDDVLADLSATRTQRWTKKAEDRQQWRLVKEAKAHPGLQRRVDGWIYIIYSIISYIPEAYRKNGEFRH
jgi:hypothetical protein